MTNPLIISARTPLVNTDSTMTSPWFRFFSNLLSTVEAGAGLAGGAAGGSGTISLGPIAAHSLSGNPTAAVAVPRAVAVGAGLSLSASGTLSATSGSGTVTSITAGAGLAGGTVTTSGTLSLAAIAAASLLANPAGSSAVPSAVTLGTNLSFAGTVLNANTGGYSPGTVPTVVQVASDTTGAASVTFGAGPTNGNYLVAMAFNPTVNTAGTGWTVQTVVSTGTDYGLIITKTAGASEPASQSPLNSAPGTGAIVAWEINGQNGSTPYAYGESQAEQIATTNVPLLVPNSLNCLGLSAVGVVPTPTITATLNAGTLDKLLNTGTRFLAASHTDLAKTPMVGLLTVFSGSASSKGATCLISS